MIKFICSGYWASWSRILGQVDCNYVELNLTPIPCCYTSTWENHVKDEFIRVHGTVRDPLKDRITYNLPDEIRQKMIANLGEELAERLLSYDYLSIIPIERIIKLRGIIPSPGGGIPWKQFLEYNERG